MSMIIIILGAVVALEQILAQVGSVKANSTFQLICNVSNELLAALRKPVQ